MVITCGLKFLATIQSVRRLKLSIQPCSHLLNNEPNPERSVALLYCRIKMSKMKILNLYSGLLGNSNLWDDTDHDITNVEINEQLVRVGKERKPNQKFILADAHQYLLDHSGEFNFIWSSRPCQSHTRMMKFTRHKLRRYPDFKLYEEIIYLQHFFKGLWVAENVVPYYKLMIEPTIKIGRHLFWSNFPIGDFDEPKQPKNFINEATVSGSEMMKEWLGIQYKGNIYYEGNHCPAQVLRNCVHPKLGLHVFNEMMNSVPQLRTK